MTKITRNRSCHYFVLTQSCIIRNLHSQGCSKIYCQMLLEKEFKTQHSVYEVNSLTLIDANPNRDLSTSSNTHSNSERLYAIQCADCYNPSVKIFYLLTMKWPWNYGPALSPRHSHFCCTDLCHYNNCCCVKFDWCFRSIQLFQTLHLTVPKESSQFSLFSSRGINLVQLD